MLPTSFSSKGVDIQLEKLPSVSYNMNRNSGNIRGKVNDADAVAQSIVKILSTDRYAYEIYTDYGNDLYTLRGKPFDYVTAEIPRMVGDALAWDGRVLKVYDFEFKKHNIDSIMVSCKVDTVYGQADIQWEVNYG